MRIIGGAWRGRSLTGPVGSGTRPTTDRARQALFDMIAHASWAQDVPLEDAVVLDAFAGTGAVGLEALSRGARHATFMENDRATIRTLTANIERCDAGERARVLVCDVLRPPRSPLAADYVFLDPPYGGDVVVRAAVALRRAGWVSERSVVITETSRGDAVSIGGVLVDDRIHGLAQFRIYRRWHTPDATDVATSPDHNRS